MRITFLGGGNMANAIIGGLITPAKGGAPIKAQDIHVLDVNVETLAVLKNRYGVSTYLVADDVPLGDVVVVAVKPQTLRALALALAPRFVSHTDSVVLSIAAGIRLQDLSQWLGGHTNVVRSMPNTPALVHAGMSGLYAPATVNAEKRQRAAMILEAVGEVLWFDDEAHLDAVTAVSGSGPAYVFYFIESLVKAAIAQGLTPDAAHRMALVTFSGAAKLALESNESPTILRERVTSKGGTTERGLAALRDGHVDEAIARAVANACERSKELGVLMAQSEVK